MRISDANDVGDFCEGTIFAALGPSQRELLARRRRRRAVAAGEVLCAEGEPARHVTCIESGTVKLTRAGERGGVQLLRLLGPGATVGLRPLVADGEFAVRATALSDGGVWTVPASVVREVLESAPTFARAVLTHLASELRYSEDLLMALTQRPVRRRVADVLLLLHGRRVRGTDWEPMPGFSLRKRDIAEMVSVAPETLSRVLAEFQRRGFIACDRHTIALRDPDGLQDVAGSQGI